MGTRNITQVILNGKTLVSQYCQWDGYPDGQGITILEFLTSMNRDKFETNLQACIPLNADATHALWKEAFIAVERPRMKVLHAELTEEEIELKFNEKLKKYEEDGMVNMDVSNEFGKYNPTLIRDMGADVLQFIQDSPVPVHLQLDLEFVKDSLMCEWAYVIDLDNNVLEVYEGFNNKPVPADNRFQLDADEVARETADGSSKYYPVVLMQKFALNDLPDNETFVKLCTPLDNDVFNSVVIDLRTMASGNAPDDKMIKHMMNYIEANKDDFMEAVGI